MTKDKIIEKTMLEFKQGKLRSGSGDIVTKRSQALAIALSKANSGKFGLGGVPKPIIELFEQGQEFLSKKYPSAQGNQSLEDTELFWDMVEDIRKHFDTETPTEYGEVGEDIVRHYLSKKFADGGKINENLEMINSDNKAIIHHAEELKIILKKNKDIPTWAVALINQAENNISNVTHYLDGKLAYDYGGMIPEVLQKVYGENLVFIDCFAQERIGMINNLYPDHAEVFIDGQFEDVPNWRITKILSKDIELNKQLIKEIQDTYMLNVGDDSDVMGLESMANGGKLVANLGAYLLAGESAKQIAPKSVNALDERLAERLNPTKPSVWEDRGLQYSDGGGIGSKKYEIIVNQHKTNLFLTLNEAENLVNNYDLKLQDIYYFPSGTRYKDTSFERIKELIKDDRYFETQIHLNKYMPNGQFFDNSVIEKIRQIKYSDGGGVDNKRTYLENRLWNERGYEYKYLRKLSLKELRSLYDTEFYYDFEDDVERWGNGGGVPDKVMEISISTLKSEFRNEPQIFSGEIIKRGPNEIKIENDILYIKRPNENWQEFRLIKFGDGGGVPYKYPKYNLPIYGTYVFKTPSETFELEIYMSERRNDTEDSLLIEEVKNSNLQLGSIIVKNSALTRLTKGMKVKAKSSIGNYSGTIEKIN